MLSLTVSRNSGQPLADQIVAGIKRQIDDRHLRPGIKLRCPRDRTPRGCWSRGLKQSDLIPGMRHFR